MINGIDLTASFEKLLTKPIKWITPLRGGRNSRVFRIQDFQGGSYVAKIYPQINLEGSNRLATEFESLNFLIENGEASIPVPVVADNASMCAIYQFIDGESIASESVSAQDIDAAVAFLLRLRSLNNADGSDKLPPASDSFFSLSDAWIGLQKRLERLRGLNGSSNTYKALNLFLEKDFQPASGKILEWCREYSELSGIDWDMPLTNQEKTLSPSDFGFHNALRKENGEIVFIDFEYFGWDDPTKMISDFLLHPGMDLRTDLKKIFTVKLLEHFRDIPQIDQRLEIVYALSGLRWTLIILNEFLPDIWSQRVSAIANDSNREDIQKRQLCKASKMLESIICEYRKFRYR